jgi:arylsulfatase A-like enzyme
MLNFRNAYLVSLAVAGAFGNQAETWAAAVTRPNVVVIITDDQGFGDLGCHGNPVIQTPTLDRFAAESVWLRNFYVSPVCAPTRACLLTGRYNYRGGVTDTYRGRAMLRPGETTLAEALAAAGYRTGIFGKWHLGDNYPLRSIDQGFSEALVHNGGGIGQPADPPESRYFNPILQHNGQATSTTGYCSNVFTGAAIEFIEAENDTPFFAYLAFNCPHDPLDVADEEAAPYRVVDLSPAAFPPIGQPLPTKTDSEAIARVYGMVTNIDRNVGQLLDALDQRGLADNTIVVFLTDNGPAHPRFNGGLRDRKGSVYEGGIRVPCYVRWPARLKAGSVVDPPTAHIDLMPTLLAACEVVPAASIAFDGSNLLPLLLDPSADWPERTLFFQWHRGDAPQQGRAFAALGPRYKLVQSLAVGEGDWTGPPRYELFDIPADPFEQHDVAAEDPEIVANLKSQYDAWFADVSRDGYAPPRIVLGTIHENPVVLTRQDWRGPRADWNAKGLGHWDVHIAAAACYDIRLRFAAATGDGATAHFRLGNVERSATVPAGATECILEAIRFPAGPARLQAWLSMTGADDVGVHYVDVNQRLASGCPDKKPTP